MQRYVVALMALTSLLMTGPLRAQDEGKAVDPAKGTVSIDEPAPAMNLSSEAPAAINTGRHNAPTAAAAAVLHAARVSTSHLRTVHSQARTPRRSWCGAQFVLMLLGLLGAWLVSVATPNAARRVADHVASNSKRDLRIGVGAGVAMLGVLFVNAILLNVPLIKILWAPLGIMIAFAPVLILGFGWLASMRYAGDAVARKLHWTGDGTTVGRMSLGVVAFFVLNVALGTVSRTLGVVGLCAELCVALMGLGATVVIASGNGFSRR